MAACDANETGLRLARLREGLQEVLRLRREADEAFRSGDYQEDKGFRDRRQVLERSQEEALAAEEERYSSRRRQIQERFSRREALAGRARSACENRLRQELQRELKVLGDVLKRAKEQMDEKPEGDASAPARSLTGLKAEIEPLRAAARELSEELDRFASGHGTRLAAPQKHPEMPGRSAASGPEPAVGRIAESLRETKRAARELRRAFWPDVAKGISIVVLLVLDLLVHGLGAAAVRHFALDERYLPALVGSLAVTAVGILVVAFIARRKAGAAANRLYADVQLALESLAELEDRNEMEERIARIMVVDEQISGQMEEKRKVCEEGLADVRRRHGELSANLARDRDDRLGRLESAHAAQVRRINGESSRELAKVQVAHDAASKRIKEEQAARTAELEARWGKLLEDFLAFAREANSGCRARHPAWRSSEWATRELPAAFPSEVPMGTAQVDLALLVGEPEGTVPFPLPAEKRVTVPVALGFPNSGSLLVEATGPARTKALETLFDAAMRLLVSFPPSKARLTIIDPVGLGQSFAALMHLADHDESLVGARIWTETAHIERKLGDLTEHIEKVIQKYLRNRYANIAEYNAEAGEMTEAYQFLVVSDFPTGFSDLALERLASIVNSGPQCGVFTLILRDTSQPMPAVLDAARLRRNGPTLAANPAGDGFVVDREDFLHAPFTAEAPPDSEGVSRLLKAVGEGAREGRRVELPFTAVVPEQGKLWNASAEEGIRVAIGRTGADRLQYLDLGRGTAQHALIGGRTGSGKSTLFHVIATNTALWFSPKEVELHMVDFKHGVEFKTYATAGLPHARVIAIESDREFGLSVLNHINRELNRRGDLFRKFGVQDLASYRQSGADEHLTRVLLVIDEFQEFFSDDDAIARDAALLLDRFVRQGRAFGVHVILGSQTLSGMYTLAKSTLGQIGVRIALQCNEADSHLILGEDNSAARLLTRPGEAIYNDMSGLIEGNSPFQVVWLPDDVRDGCLRQVAEKAAQDKYQPPASMVVFEGNVPAELSRNPELRELLAAPAAEEAKGKGKGKAGAAAAPATERIWLGEANAIKGPVQISLVPATGNNVLIVGQHREGALATLCSAAVSLAASNRPERIRMIALGADGRDAASAETLVRLAAALPHGIETPASRDIPRIVEELEKLVAEVRESGQPPERRVYLMVYGLQRFQALRHEEDFGLSGSDGASTGERFANVLREGPESGVHSLVWCDTLGNLNRSVSRKTMREFDLRILFQMSSSDSSELIDSAAAGNLGLHNALLVCQSEGASEKFRPYTMPDPGYLEEVGRQIAARFGLKK